MTIRHLDYDHPIAKLVRSGKLKPGMEITDNAFVSTSLYEPDGLYGDDDYNLVISVPEGTRGVYLGERGRGNKAISKYPTLMLDKGTTFKVNRVNPGRIEIEVVKQDDGW